MTEADDTLPDDLMTPEEEAVTQSFTPAVIQRIDDCLLSNISDQWRKVARVIAMTMPELPGVPIAFLSVRIKHLAASGVLDAAGNLSRMRYSEIRRHHAGMADSK